MIYSIETVVFQRRSGGKKEKGILLNENGVIIDQNLKEVGRVWNYDRVPGIALYNLNIGEEQPKKGEVKP